MEKIQSALAKARAKRAAGKEAGHTEAANERQSDTAVLTPQTSIIAARDDTAAAWDALPVFEVDPKRLQRHRIVAVEGGYEATSIDMMRTRVLQQMRDNGWRRLAITSPTAACGKSTVALNLAMSLQRLADMRTILIELDLRRPSLHRILDLDGEKSFAHVLERSGSFADNAVRYGSNLVISGNSRPSRSTAELLISDHMAEILTQIEMDYAPDLIIFDTPPMLAADDMMAFARHADCALLVAAAETTTTKEVDICETDLARQTNVMGVVLNKCRYMGPEYGYGYYG